MYDYGLLGALGAIGLSLFTDKTTYLVGEKPIFSLVGAVPGSTIAWTSFKDGEPTGEYNATYGGQAIGANGTAELEGGAWTEDQIGSWQKQVAVIAPDGTISPAQVFFNVRSAAAAPAPAPASSASGFWSGSFTIGGARIPNLLALGVVAFFLLKKK